MSFFTGRQTVPMPLGPLTDVFELARQRDAGALVLQRIQPGPCLPVTPLLPYDTGGDHFCVYPLEQAPEAIAAKLPPELAGFRPFDEQLATYPRPGPFRSALVLLVLAAPFGVGLLLVLLVFAAFVGAARLKVPVMSWVAVGVLTLATALAGVVFGLG